MNGSQSRPGRYGQTRAARPVVYSRYTLSYPGTPAPLAHTSYVPYIMYHNFNLYTQHLPKLRSSALLRRK